MSFIKQSPISYEESIVLRFALQRILPHFENVKDDAKEPARKEKAETNIKVAQDMLADLNESLKPFPQ